MAEKCWDCVMVGGGIAGLTAGLYAARAGLEALLLERMYPGGQIVNASIVENFPGFPDGLGGPELVMKLEAQARRFGLSIQYAEVTSAQWNGREKELYLSDGTMVRARTVILCMGAEHRPLGVAGEMKYAGRGISYCATCDGALYRGQDVMVIGGGDTAAEEALLLSHIASHVTLVHRRDALRASDVLQQRLFAAKNIDIRWNSVIAALHGEAAIERVTLRNTVSGAEEDVATSCLFVAVGMLPLSSLVKDALSLNNGYIETNDRMATPIEGVWAAGDIRVKLLRQLVTAAADGATAAHAAWQYLDEQGI